MSELEEQHRNYLALIIALTLGVALLVLVARKLQK